MKSIRDPKVDAYIEKSAEFARPILRHLRKLVHRACSTAEESLKWNFPFFVHHGLLCYMGGFKQHCSFGFRRQGMNEILRKDGRLSSDGMGSFGRITSLADLPNDKTLLRYIREAVKLNEAGAPVRTSLKPRPPAKPPADLMAALRKNKNAATNFKKFSPYQRREYIEWITEAKQSETRVKRLATTIKWLAEGKPRNWKYMNC